MRRLFFAYTIAQVFHTIVFQVYVVDYLSLAFLIYFVTVRPMKDSTNNFIQIFNEAVVLSCI